MANGEQDQAAKHAEAQRRAAAGQAQANAPSAQQQQVAQHDANAARAEADRRNTELLERSREERANRPQGVGGKPTPTQAENDEFRLGLRGLDDKEDDGSGPDYGVLLDEHRAKFQQERSKAVSANR